MPDTCENGEYTVESGVVVDAGPEYVVVRIAMKEEDCGGCSACSMKSLCGGRRDGTIDLRAPASGGADGATAPAKGDAVRVAYRPANAAAAALVMFLPPLLGLLAGGFAGYRLAGGDAVFLAGCAVGIAAGVGVSVALSRLSPALKPVVHILP